MAGYQFMHMECYARTSRKGAKAKAKQKTAKAGKPVGNGRTADEVIAEAAREAGSHPHVADPRQPRIVDSCRDGYTFDDLKADYEDACNARVTLANGRTRKNRSTALTLATMVCSYPVPVSELKTKQQQADYRRWRSRVIQYARSEFGDDYRLAVQHLDEEYPHLHVFAVAPDASRLHPGLSAARLAEQNGKTGRDLGKAAVDGLRAAQDRYYTAVGQPEGQARLGPKRQRLTRAGWQDQQFANEKTAAMLNAPAELEAAADARAVVRWRNERWDRKLLTAPEKLTFAEKNRIRREAITAAEGQAKKSIDKAESAANAARAERNAARAERDAAVRDRDAAQAESAGLRDSLNTETARNKTLGLQAQSLDTLLAHVLPTLPPRLQRQIGVTLAETAPNSRSARTATACAPSPTPSPTAEQGGQFYGDNLEAITAAESRKNNRGGPGGMG